MLHIDFSKILPQRETTLKSTSKKKTPNKSKKVKDEVVYKTLGDFARLQVLPDMISDEFVAIYSQSLEEILLPYVSSNLLSIGYASEYRKRLVEMIFGSENHLGLYNYLKERDVENKSDKELIFYAEQLILKGWQIRKEDNQYWLINGDLNRVIEMTGRAPMYKEVAVLSFDEASAHIFLDDSTASKISALAKTLGHDADTLAATGNLDVLLARISDDKFAGYVINYNALRRILKKGSRFNTSVEGFTMMELHHGGYRLSSKLTLPFSEKAIFVNGENEYSMVPVKDEINKVYFVNKYLLASIAAKVKKDLLTGSKVVCPDLLEVKEFRNTFALLTELYPEEFSNNTFSQTLDILDGLSSSSRGIETKVVSSVAMLAVVEAILLGNKRFNPASFSVDSVSGKVFSHTSKDYFAVSEEELDTFSFVESPYVDSSVFSNRLFFADITNPENADSISTLVSLLPDTFKQKLASYQMDLSMYPYEFAGLKNYFEKAKRLIVGI